MQSPSDFLPLTSERGELSTTLNSRTPMEKLNKNQSTWIFSTPKLDCCLVNIETGWYYSHVMLLPRGCQVEPIAKRLKSTASSQRVETVLFDFDGTLTMREANGKEWQKTGCDESPTVVFVKEFILGVSYFSMFLSRKSLVLGCVTFPNISLQLKTSRFVKKHHI